MTRPAMIFAAGFGTRMGELTRTRPKPLIEVAGRTLLDRNLDLARGAGACPLVVNAHYKADQIADHLSEQPDVTLCIESPDILDTGGGFKAALPTFGAADCVFLLNSDAVFTGPAPHDPLVAGWRPGMGALLLLVPQDRAVGRKEGGDFALGDDGRLNRDKGALVYTGLQIVAPDAVRGVPDRVFSIGRVWDKLAAEGRLFGVVHPGRWADVGHPEGIGLAEDMLRTDASG